MGFSCGSLVRGSFAQWIVCMEEQWGELAYFVGWKPKIISTFFSTAFSQRKCGEESMGCTIFLGPITTGPEFLLGQQSITGKKLVLAARWLV